MEDNVLEETERNDWEVAGTDCNGLKLNIVLLDIGTLLKLAPN